MSLRLKMLALALIAPSAQAAGNTVDIDYTVFVGTGSPNIFGATHYPSLTPENEDADIGDHSAVWPMLTDQMGVRYMRAHRATGTYLNGLSDPKSWNWVQLYRWVDKANENGFLVTAMAFQIPAWLNSTAGSAGAPEDWGGYRDIISKLYLLKNRVDYSASIRLIL